MAEPGAAESPYRAARAELEAALAQAGVEVKTVRGAAERGRKTGAERWQRIGAGLADLWHNQVGARPRLKALRRLAWALPGGLKRADPPLAQLRRQLRRVRSGLRRLPKVSRRSSEVHAIRLRKLGLRLRLHRTKLLTSVLVLGGLSYLWLSDTPLGAKLRDLWQLALMGWDLA